MSYSWIIGARLADLGFTPQPMGGNVRSYERTDGQVQELIGSDEHPGHLPTRLDERVVVTAQAADGSDDPDVARGFTLAQVLASLRNPSTEYTLLTLRLRNGIL